MSNSEQQHHWGHSIVHTALLCMLLYCACCFIVHAALRRQSPEKADSPFWGRHGLVSAMWRRSDPHARPSFSYLLRRRPTQSSRYLGSVLIWLIALGLSLGVVLPVRAELKDDPIPSNFQHLQFVAKLPNLGRER